MESDQGKQKNVLLHVIYLLVSLFLEKFFFEVKFGFFVSIEAKVRHLNEKIINPGKLLASVK